MFTGMICIVCLLLPAPPVLIAFGLIQAIIAWDYMRTNRYLTFYRSIGKIAKEVGDPVAAFRITSEKMPTTMKELKNPLDFYKDEIAAAKEKKAAENAQAPAPA